MHRQGYHFSIRFSDCSYCLRIRLRPIFNLGQFQGVTCMPCSQPPGPVSSISVTWPAHVLWLSLCLVPLTARTPAADFYQAPADINIYHSPSIKPVSPDFNCWETPVWCSHPSSATPSPADCKSMRLVQLVKLSRG